MGANTGFGVVYDHQSRISLMTSSRVLHRSPGHGYPVAVRAAGMHVVDSAGREYLDMSGGAAVSCVGHSHPRVVDAIRMQVEKLAFAHTSFFTNEPSKFLSQEFKRVLGADRG